MCYFSFFSFPPRHDRTNHTVIDLTVNESFTLFICMAGRSAKGVTFCYPLVFYRIIRSLTGVANHDGGFVLGILCAGSINPRLFTPPESTSFIQSLINPKGEQGDDAE